jgi:hypothetical protein
MKSTYLVIKMALVVFAEVLLDAPFVAELWTRPKDGYAHKTIFFRISTTFFT